MANRHTVQKRKEGGRTFYAGGDSNVAKEAAEHKLGGRIKRAFGGRTVGAPAGRKAGGRLDKRARGGRAGADQHPFSSAKKG